MEPVYNEQGELEWPRAMLLIHRGADYMPEPEVIY